MTELLGTRLDFGKSELFFTDGIGEAEAKQVGTTLVREQYFGERGSTVQLRYVDRRYQLRCAVRAGVEHDQSTNIAWRRLAEKVSTECFRTSPVDVHLCDEKMKTLSVVKFEPIRPELPLKVTFRPSIGGGSLVAQYRNTSSKYLTVIVTLRNATVAESRIITLNIAANQMTEHGWTDGWEYKSGETIKITNADFESLELVVP